MQSLPAEDKTEHAHTNLTKACMEFMKAEVFDKDPASDRKARIAFCVAMSIATDRAQTGLAKEICDRLRKVEDLNRHLMVEVFNLSIVTDRVCILLDDVIIHRKHVSKDIQHELCVEFVLLFFGIVESILRRGHHHGNNNHDFAFGELEYATSATPSDMTNARDILEKHASAIAAMCGPCFKLKALKKSRPRLNLFPAHGAPPQTTTLGTDPVDFAGCGFDVLTSSLLSNSKETDTFLDIIFAIVSLSHKTPADTLETIKLNSTKTFLLENVLDKAAADCAMQRDKDAILLENQVKTLAQELSAIEAKLDDTRQLLQQEKRRCSELEADKESLLATNRSLAFKADMAESRLDAGHEDITSRLDQSLQENDRLQKVCDKQKKKYAAVIGEKKRTRDMYEDRLAQASADKKRVVDMHEAQKTKVTEALEENKKLRDTIDGKKPRVDRPKICPHQLFDAMYFGSGYRTP
ncbi:unnamed protein product [Ectocarpus sp. CCAP 1310/34]|nr:unnamed protein product [Ectocarpus sp. CCAP 1310/34]